MTYFLRIVGEGHGNQVWNIDESTATPLGASNTEGRISTDNRHSDRKNIWAALREDTDWFPPDGPETGPFHKLELPPWHYYPRVARPLNGSLEHLKSPSAREEQNAIALGVGQATALMQRLQSVCQTIHPCPETFGTYGHEVRNLLILAATEVEAHWRGVLVANGRQKERYKTTDYVNLLPLMRLDEYTVAFRSFPWLEPIRPFSGWSGDKSTRSLDWYKAYNHVKHDREGAFPSARLDHAFAAVSACVIMLAAQWTPSTGLRGHSELSAFFEFKNKPRWLPEESYTQFQSLGETQWMKCQCDGNSGHPLSKENKGLNTVSARTPATPSS